MHHQNHLSRHLFKGNINTSHLRLLLLLLCAALLGACSKGVRDEAPFGQISSWRIDGQELHLELRLRNVNEEALLLSALTLNVALDQGTELISLQRNTNLEIAAGGFETIPLRATGSSAGVTLLEQLAAGDRASLAYTLSGTVSSRQSGELDFNREGHIYNVPGRPGAFR
jgi:hypothetical protein